MNNTELIEAYETKLKKSTGYSFCELKDVFRQLLQCIHKEYSLGKLFTMRYVEPDFFRNRYLKRCTEDVVFLKVGK